MSETNEMTEATLCGAKAKGGEDGAESYSCAKPNGHRGRHVWGRAELVATMAAITRGGTMTEPMTFDHEDQFAEWWGGQPLQPDVVLTQWHERKARKAFAAGVAAGRKPLVEALAELLTVAELRGDDQLPHPADDDKLWTARMQTAWDDARAALAKGAEMQEATEPVGVEAEEGEGA